MLRTLVLNADYSPINIITWQEAITKVLCSHSATPIENYPNKVVRDGRGNEYDVPAVIITKKYVGVFNKLAPYSKNNVYARDLEICQYCGEKTSHKNRTVDHIIPKSKFDKRKHQFRCSSFENVVTCCRPCNVKKGDRTLKDSGMTLLRQPRRIMQRDAYANKLQLGTIPSIWNKYLIYDEEQNSKN